MEMEIRDVFATLNGCRVLSHADDTTTFYLLTALLIPHEYS